MATAKVTAEYFTETEDWRNELSVTALELEGIVLVNAPDGKWALVPQALAIADYSVAPFNGDSGADFEDSDIVAYA
jgi:hypothetical protein